MYRAQATGGNRLLFACRETTTYKAINRQIYFMGAPRITVITEDPLENLVSSATMDEDLPGLRSRGKSVRYRS